MKFLEILSLLPASKSKYLSLKADNLSRAQTPRFPGSLANTRSADFVAAKDEISAGKVRMIEIAAVAVIGGVLTFIDYRVALIAAVAYELVGNAYNVGKYFRKSS